MLPRGWWAQEGTPWEKWSFEIALQVLSHSLHATSRFSVGKSSLFFFSLPIFPLPPERGCLHVKERVYHCAHGLGRFVCSSERLEAVTQSKQGPSPRVHSPGDRTGDRKNSFNRWPFFPIHRPRVPVQIRASSKEFLKGRSVCIKIIRQTYWLCALSATSTGAWCHHLSPYDQPLSWLTDKTGQLRAVSPQYTAQLWLAPALRDSKTLMPLTVPCCPTTCLLWRIQENRPVREAKCRTVPLPQSNHSSLIEI